MQDIPTERELRFFWDKVDKSGECWEWTGYVNAKGYGQLRRRHRGVLAPRYSWTIHNGEIAQGLYVCHKCDNPLCVRPDHLFLGTQKDNMVDASNKGRIRSGEMSPLSKLSQESIKNIRRVNSTGKYPQWKIAEMFGLSQPNVSRIVRHITWKQQTSEV